MEEAETAVWFTELCQTGLEVRLEEGVFHALYAGDGNLCRQRLRGEEVRAGGEFAGFTREHYKAALCQTRHLLVIEHSHALDLGARTFVYGYVCDFGKFYPAPAIHDTSGLKPMHSIQ